MKAINETMVKSGEIGELCEQMKQRHPNIVIKLIKRSYNYETYHMFMLT
jgi:hypothetical protein